MRDIQNVETWLLNARQSSYDAATLSEILQISRRQLQRQTKRIFGLSPQKWLDRQRLIEAVKLLKQSRIKEVSYVLGYKHVSHFSREFKRFYGLPPKAYFQTAQLNSALSFTPNYSEG